MVESWQSGDLVLAADDTLWRRHPPHHASISPEEVPTKRASLEMDCACGGYRHLYGTGPRCHLGAPPHPTG